MFLLTSAFGSAIGIALSPTAEDPKLMWMYIGLAISAVIAGAIFWLLFKQYNDTEEEMNSLSRKNIDDEPVPVTEMRAAARNRDVGIDEEKR